MLAFFARVRHVGVLHKKGATLKSCAGLLFGYLSFQGEPFPFGKSSKIS